MTVEGYQKGGDSRGEGSPTEEGEQNGLGGRDAAVEGSEVTWTLRARRRREFGGDLRLWRIAGVTKVSVAWFARRRAGVGDRGCESTTRGKQEGHDSHRERCAAREHSRLSGTREALRVRTEGGGESTERGTNQGTQRRRGGARRLGEERKGRRVTKKNERSLALLVLLSSRA
ncbi:hypothetical protein ERJ75_000780100 [Trypanosoma vivax]|nr:hypothetical protein ERJ75_000780100 [Trypanosoma vivax]